MDDKLRPEGDGSVYLDPTAIELLRQYQDAARAIGLWTERKREVKDAIVALMGTADRGHYAGQQVLTVVRTRPRRFNVHAFSADHPGLFEQYRETPDEDEVRLSIVKELPSAVRDAA